MTDLVEAPMTAIVTPILPSVFPEGFWTRGVTADQNLCLWNETDIIQPEPPEIIAGFVPWNRTAVDRTHDFNRAGRENCETESLINYLMGQLFLTEFRLDQRDRKMMIEKLYTATLHKDTGLDGKLIKDGVREVLKKNLTYVNEKNFQPAAIDTFSSLKDKNFTEFLKRIDIFPVLEHMEFPGGGSATTLCPMRLENSQKRYVGSNTPASSDFERKLRQFIADNSPIFQYNTSRPNNLPDGRFMHALSLGYKRVMNTDKNPKLPVYYGVAVKLSQTGSIRQIFSPFTRNDTETLEFKASAFAKPFGARIGPKEIDSLIRRQHEVLNSSQGARINPLDLKPNHSRYPGDKAGLIHTTVHNQYYLIKKQSSPGNSPYKLEIYANLTDNSALADIDLNNPNDPNKSSRFLKIMELMAVAPDLYDVFNYTILNNYMAVYFKKIKQLIAPGGDLSIGGEQGFIRGNLDCDNRPEPPQAPWGCHNGPKNGPGRKHYSEIAPFYRFPANLNGSLSLDNLHNNIADYVYENFPPYILNDPSFLLTGFVPPIKPDRYDSYEEHEKSPFMKCPTPDSKTSDKHVPSGCARGGRAGYSVKLISCKMVEALSPGNRPAGFNDKYCSD